MKAIDIPANFPKYWGLDAAGGNINDIPVDSTGVAGRASLDIGYPPETMVPLGSGGTPPFGQDTNGIFRQITQSIQWTSNAGAPFVYDATFSAAIGGYPEGAVLASTSQPGAYWLSVADDNTVDPEAGVSANWQFNYGPVFFGTDTGAKNAGAITLKPAPASLANLAGRPLVVQKINTAQDGNYTLNVNGLGAIPVIQPNGAQLPAGTLSAHSVFIVCLDVNSNFELMSGGTGGSSGGRIVLSGNTDFYISTTGSDANNGTSSGTPWLTFSHAWNVLTQNYDLAGFTATVHAADGTYTTGGGFSGVPTIGGGKIVFQSTSGSSATCIVNVSSGNCFTLTNGAVVTVNNIKLISATGDGFFIGAQSSLNFAGIDFGACGSYQIFVDEQGRANPTGNYTISGSAVNHWNVQSASEFHIGTTSITITITGTPAFTAFSRAANNSLIVFNSLPTFSGSATGQRYNATYGGVINTGSGNVNFLPGNSAGSVTPGGQYN